MTLWWYPFTTYYFVVIKKIAVPIIFRTHYMLLITNINMGIFMLPSPKLSVKEILSL